MHVPTPSSRRWLFAACALALLPLTTGCGKTGTVTGEVKFDDKPLKSGRITFIHNEEGKDPVEVTGTIADGQYEVNNVPLGRCRVKVTSLFPAGGMPNIDGMPGGGGPPMPGGGGGRPGGFDPRAVEKMRERMKKEHPEEGGEISDIAAHNVEIPDLYADPEQSKLEHTVTRGTTTYDIELKSPPDWKPTSERMKKKNRGGR